MVDLNVGTTERQLQIAKEYVTEAQLASLRTRARGKFPALTDGDLSSMGLTWQHMSLQDGQHVMVVITFMPESSGVDAKAVADYVAAEILKDITPKLEAVEKTGDAQSLAPPNEALKLTKHRVREVTRCFAA